MMSMLPKTRTAAGYIARHLRGAPAGVRAAVLLTRLDACEAALAGVGAGAHAHAHAHADGEVPAVAHDLLRDLVLAARDLVGPAWLAADGEDPDIAAFAALRATPAPPAPAELDEIISRLLWFRFAPHCPARDGTGLDGPGLDGAARDGVGLDGAGMDGAGRLDISVAAGESGPVLALSGEADLTNVARLSRALTAQVSGGTRHLTVDLSRLRFADSAAIRALILTNRALKERGGTLELLRPQPAVTRILGLLGVNQVLTVHL